MINSFEQEPKQKNGDQLLGSYQYVLDTFNKDTFHPTGIDSSTMSDYLSRDDVMTIAGVPSLIRAESAAPLLIDKDRFEFLAQKVAPDIEQAERYVSAVPLQFLVENVHLLPQNKDTLLLADLEHNDTALVEKIEKSGARVYTLKHPVFGSEAGLSLLRIDMQPITPIDGAPLNFEQTLRGGRIESTTLLKDGTMIARRMGGDFSPIEMEKIVKLFRTRFEDISPHMPIRLDDTDEATRELLNDGRYMFLTSSTPTTGEILACLFFTDQPGAYPWINEQYLADHTPNSQSTSTHHVFVPALAKQRHAPAKSGAILVDDYCSIEKATAQPRIVNWFECTDISKHVVGPTARVAISKFFDGIVEEIDTKTYVFVRVPGQVLAQ